MDREALVRRNRAMTEAFHAIPLKHHVRRMFLRLLAMLPIRKQRPGHHQRILLIRPDHLGDVLLATPAIRALRAVLPYAELHALVGNWSAEALRNYDELDTVLTLPFPGFSREEKTNWRAPYELAFQAAHKLRKIGYSSALIMRPDHWWGALVTRLAGIPQRIGYATPDVEPFLTRAFPHEHRHAILQNLQLVTPWTGPIQVEKIDFSFPIADEDRSYIDDYLDDCGIARGKAIICIHPGSGTWVKRWEDSHWALVADALSEQLDAAAVFTGGSHELSAVRMITAHMRHPACILAGNTEVGQLAALYARARVVIGPDSGPLHLAAAVNTPTVTLFGPADPLEFAPWGSRDRHYILTSDIGCRPCRVIDWAGDDLQFHPCVREILPGRLLEAARRAALHKQPD